MGGGKRKGEGVRRRGVELVLKVGEGKGVSG